MSDAQIFQVFSLIYICVGIGIFVNPTFYKKLFAEFVESTSAMYMGGIMVLTVGYLIVAFHNTWTADFSVIITVLGWLALVKGILILVWPKVIVAVTKSIIRNEKNLKIQAVAVIALGVLLAFLGFCPKSPI